MNEERIQILKMLETGKISADEASRLLQAVETTSDRVRSDAPGAEWLRVRVVDSGGAEKVNVNVPLSLLNVVVKFIPEKVMKEHGVDVDFHELFTAIREGARGKLVEVHDEKEGTHVEVVVE